MNRSLAVLIVLLPLPIHGQPTLDLVGKWAFRPDPEKVCAELTISDWKSGDNGSGPVGQETSVNFIEIQPYFEP